MWCDPSCLSWLLKAARTGLLEGKDWKVSQLPFRLGEADLAARGWACQGQLPFSYTSDNLNLWNSGWDLSLWILFGAQGSLPYSLSDLPIFEVYWMQPKVPFYILQHQSGSFSVTSYCSTVVMYKSLAFQRSHLVLVTPDPSRVTAVCNVGCSSRMCVM